MSIYTGRQMHAYQWTEIPITDYDIDNAEGLSGEEDQLVMTKG